MPHPPPPADAGLSTPDRGRLLADLRAVVIALDLRTTHPGRLAEAGIAADARALRQEAVRRIAALESEPPTP